MTAGSRLHALFARAGHHIHPQQATGRSPNQGSNKAGATSSTDRVGWARGHRREASSAADSMAQAAGSATVATAASTNTFVRAVHVVFGEWSCLKLAVENEWAGGHTRERALTLLRTVLDGLLKSSTVHRDELEGLLDVALIDDFNIEAEDDSPSQVAQLLIKLHAEAKVGVTTTAEQLLARAAGKGSSWVECPPPPKPKVDSSDDEDDGEEGDDDAAGRTPRGGGDGPSAMDEEGPSAGGGRPAPEIDEEGFETVTPRRGRGKR